jgi:hypothetical protein
MRLGGSSIAVGVNDIVGCPPEESTGTEVQHCIRNGSEGGGHPCVGKVMRTGALVGKERKRGDSQSMTTNGGKEKPPTRDRHQKKRRKITRFARWQHVSQKAGKERKRGK